MKKLATYEHLFRRNERMGQKNISQKIAERERQKILNVLDPRNYDSQDDVLEVLSSILHTFKPGAKITRIHERGGRFFTDDRQGFPVSERDTLSIAHHGINHLIQGDNGTLYYYSEAGIYAITGVDQDSHRQIVRILLPISGNINSTLMTIDDFNQDPLTGLYNVYAASRIMQRLDNEKSNCAIIMLDMRDLTGMNAIGQKIGDSALQLFGQGLQKIFQRKTDFVMRIGGDEFMVIMQFEKDTPLEKQKEVTKTALEKAQKYFDTGEDGKGGFQMVDGIFRQITFASGVGHSDVGQNSKEKLEKADEGVRHTKSPGSAVSKLLQLLDGGAPIPARQLGRLLGATEQVINNLPSEEQKQAIQGYSDRIFNN